MPKFGTFRKCRDIQATSVERGKADMAVCHRSRASFRLPPVMILAIGIEHAHDVTVQRAQQALESRI
jgi:hypothetical protein